MNKEVSILLTCREAAKFIGITEAALRKRIHLRQVKGLVRLGGRIFFHRKKLEKFLNELEEACD